MKNNTIIFAVLLFCITGLTSCKKENESPPPTPEDLSRLFKNTVWTGLIKYTDGELANIAQPYNIAFDGNGSFEWEEYGGSYRGNYTLDNKAKKIILQFTGASNANVTIEIVGAKVFGSITLAANYPWEILNGKLNDVSGQLLENTTWKGSFNVSSIEQTREFKFLAGQQVSASGGGTFKGPFNYVRKNGTVRLDWFITRPFKEFMVLLPGNKMTIVERGESGSGSSSEHHFYVYGVNKQ